VTSGLTLSEAWRIGRLDAHGQAQLLRSGEATATDLVEAAILRIESLDSRLNALTVRSFQPARERAAASRSNSGLCGVPYLLKDGLDYPGMPSRCGSRSKATAPTASVRHEYARRLDGAGLIPLGKTNVPEFGLLPTTESLLYGAARNPWSLEHSPGGSSGGAAVAVAAGMVALGHAADGGGSIRIPASCCGLVGLKPGRNGNVRARDRHFIEDFLVGDVLLSRTVRDSAWAFSLESPDARPMVSSISSQRLRIAVAPRNLLGELPHPDVADAIARTADLCAKLGHEVTDAWPSIDGAAVIETFKTFWGYLAGGTVDFVRAAHPGAPLEDILEPWTLELAEWGLQLDGEHLERAFAHATQSSAAMSAFFGTHDAILSPVVRTPPPRIGQLAPTRPLAQLMPEMFDYVSYTPLHNLTGHPAISLPLFVSRDGLPIGSMFAAARGREDLLLSLAYELERECPWADRWPGIVAG
jgi:amidase